MNPTVQRTATRVPEVQRTVAGRGSNVPPVPMLPTDWHDSFSAGGAKSELRSSTANDKSGVSPRLLESGPHLHLLGVGLERCCRGRAYIVGSVPREILEERRREHREGGAAQVFPRLCTDSSVSGFSPDLEHSVRSSLIEHRRQASAINALMERCK